MIAKTFYVLSYSFNYSYLFRFTFHVAQLFYDCFIAPHQLRLKSTFSGNVLEKPKESRNMI